MTNSIPAHILSGIPTRAPLHVRLQSIWAGWFNPSLKKKRTAVDKRVGDYLLKYVIAALAVEGIKQEEISEEDAHQIAREVIQLSGSIARLVK
jgi:hypothetical protein